MTHMAAPRLPFRPPKPGALSRLRLNAATSAGKAAAAASRLARRGTGASIQGTVMLRLDPGALGKLLADRRIASVSGTNGKTTTTHLLTAAVRASVADPDDVVTNADGANLHHGIASALANQPRSSIAVLETDERVVATVIELGRPEVLVLLNFSRDQLDRHHEIKSLGRSWRIALQAAGSSGPVVVANACDPLVVWSAQPARRVIWVDTGDVWNEDAALCPECGSLLVRDQSRWDCPGCSLTQPVADYTVRGDEVSDPNGRVFTLDLQVPGRFNRANAACALAAARAMGVPAQTALDGMATVTSPAGRYATATIGTARATLLLAKNPSGWAESLPLATSQTVVLAIDSAAADGRDVSWLWDVRYEQLAGRTVVATGPRAQDLAVRLRHAGVDHVVEPDLTAAFRRPEVTRVDGPVDVIATYTPFQRLRKLGGLA
ncbi:Lipid II isoglutaminyl synthase (glutamine-hydrolyzing) subunit MurT [Aestuariimicrobium sp. T2.26MG-19.2B]|nr:Mur ligase family protein [Aestuariimicrobium sp. T2.26MG-19.2B]CAI9407647.1 Lipid II isoglutaminyl synthase (glutamine-hydrolyzing) subunit MurT [Aestuariimicrobium sp. T2.26MG-19.2B]